MWKADIGSWEKGKRVDLPRAYSVVTALEDANDQIQNCDEFDSETSYVVKIINDYGKVVWTYMDSHELV